MLLEKVYSDFIEHTGLVDSMYKSVFIQISDILELVNDTKIEYLQYSMNDENYQYKFHELESIPSYIVEIAKNLFEEFYTVPEQATIILGISRNNRIYDIISENGKIYIPEELEYFKKYKLFDFFIIGKRVYDIFDEFDNLFRFVKEFKKPQKEVLPILKELFEKNNAKEDINIAVLSNESVARSQSFIESLSEKKKEYLIKLEEIHKTQQVLLEDKQALDINLRRRESLSFEETKLQQDYKAHSNTITEYRVQINKLEDTIKEIEKELGGFKEQDSHSEEVTFLKNRKISFLGYIKEFEDAISRVELITFDTKTRLEEIKETLDRLRQLSSNDLITIKESLKNLDKERDKLQGLILSADSEIQQRALQVAEDTNSIRIAEDPSLSSDDVIKQLSIREQPSSIAMVISYIKNYFAFISTKIADTLIQDKNTDVGIVQAISCRIALVRLFGMYFQLVFSSFPFIENRYKKVINIVLEK